MIRTSNPALSQRVFQKQMDLPISGQMTIKGTINKSLILLFLIFATAGIAWNYSASGASWFTPALVGSGILGFILAIVTIFNPKISRYTATGYAIVEGFLLGGISAIFNAQYQGIVLQAILLTLTTLLFMLFAYRSKMIRATPMFRRVIIIATGSIAVIYILQIFLGWLNVRFLSMIHESGTTGIIFSIVVLVVAALNLILDFDFIEKSAKAGAPKYMEWFGAFGLMITLVWLYLEFLRLLSKLRR